MKFGNMLHSLKGKIQIMIMSKKGQKAVSSEGLTDKLIGVMVFAFIAAAIVPIVLTSFLNLSGSGIALASLFGSVLGILLAVFLFKALFRGLR